MSAKMLKSNRQDVFLITFISLLIIIHLPSTNAEITTVTISSDSRPTIRFNNFCFTTTGHISIALSNVSVTTTSAAPINSSRLGFYLSRLEVLEYYGIQPFEDGKTCITETPNLIPGAFDPIATFAELSPPPQSSINKTLSAPKPQSYGIYFANCEPKTSVSMHVRIETFNIDEDGEKNYLQNGETQLPAIFFGFSIFYVLFLVIWICVCCWRRSSVYKIHLLMAALLLMKSLNLLFASEDKQFINATGTPHGWDILFYTFHSIRALLLFTVIMLIGTGWSFLKPFLQENEKKWLAIGITLQVFTNIAYVYIGEESGPFAKYYSYWVGAFVVTYIVCCYVVLAPILLSIKSLKEAAKADGKAARTLEKMRLFRNFYAWVFFYEFSTMTVKYVFTVDASTGTRASMGTCSLLWTDDAFQESAAVLFYVVMFFMFRPMEHNGYFVLHDEEEESAALAIIRSSEFEMV